MGEREREQKTNRERERERKRVFQLAGKQARRRAEESKGRRRREAAHSTDWTLDLCYRYFHSSANSHCFGS